jgi:hypothetical protein
VTEQERKQRIEKLKASQREAWERFERNDRETERVLALLARARAKLAASR